MKKNVKIPLLMLLMVLFSCSETGIDEEILSVEGQENLIESKESEVTKNSAINFTTPDYRAICFSGNSIVTGSGSVDFRVLMAEYNDVENLANAPRVRLLVRKKPGLTISFNQNLTSLDGNPVSNSDWEMVSDNLNWYRFRYIGNGGVFPGNSFSFIGINATLDCSLASSDVELKVRVKGNSGGQVNTANDVDIDYLICSEVSETDFTTKVNVSQSQFTQNSSK